MQRLRHLLILFYSFLTSTVKRLRPSLVGDARQLFSRLINRLNDISDRTGKHAVSQSINQ